MKDRFQCAQTETGSVAPSNNLHADTLPRAPHMPTSGETFKAIKNHLVVAVFALALLGMTGAFAWKLVKRVHEARTKPPHQSAPRPAIKSPTSSLPVQHSPV